MKIHRHFNRPLAQNLFGPMRRQSLIEMPFQLGQVFDLQLRIQVQPHGLGIRPIFHFPAHGSERSLLGRHADQHLIERRRRTGITFRVQVEMLFQGVLRLAQDFRIRQFRLIISYILFFMACPFLGETLSKADKPFCCQCLCQQIRQIWNY